MKKALFFIFFFQCVAFHGQKLEDKIYNAIDTFVANKNITSLEKLTTQESDFQPKVTTEKEQLALVILQCNKAYYLKEINRETEAISSYEKAWKSYSENKLTNYNIIEYCLKPLGNLYTKTSDFTNAENTIKYYIFLAEKQQNKSQKIAGIINLSKVYQTVGKHAAVIGLINDLFKIKELNKDQKLKLEKIRSMSLLFLKNDKNTFKNKDKSSLLSDLKSATQNDIKYKIALQEGDYENALFYFKKQKFKNGIPNRQKAKLLVEEAQLYYLLKEPKKAKICLDNSLQILLPNNLTITNEVLYAENTFISIFDLYAKIEMNPQKALQRYQQSFYVSALLEKNFTTQETSILHQTEKRNRSEKCIELLLEIYNITQNNKLIEEAFTFAEKGKSSVLLAQLLRKQLLLKYTKDSLLINENTLLQHQEELTNLLINEQLSSAKPTVISELNLKLNNISIQLKGLQSKIDKKYYIEKEDSFLLADLQRKLSKENTVFVEYFYGKYNIYQFVITASSIAVNQIEINDTIKNKITAYIRFFDSPSAINNNIKTFVSSAFSLYRELLFFKVSTYKNVIIVPDGLLNNIPFETLIINSTSERNFSKMPFLVKKQNVVYSLSANLFLEDKKTTQKEKILGIFPVFSNTNKELKYSIDEAKSIKNEVSSNLLMNEAATKENFLKLAPKHTILHLSTHASGGDFTTPANIDFFDKKLTLNELYSLKLPANLAILSACETGIGRVLKGEGTMSVARGFRYAGVKNVLFTLWKINDKSTAILMKSFYENYSEYNSINTANQYAKTAYLNNNKIENSKKSPYYWGAFVYYGEVIQPSKTAELSLFFIGFMAIIVIYLAFIFLKKLRK